MIQILPIEENAPFQQLLGKELFERQHSSKQICIPLENGGFFLAFNFCDVRSPEKRDPRITVYCDGEKLILAGAHTRCGKVLSALPEQQPLFSTLAVFFIELTAGDVEELDRMENKINEMENRLMLSVRPEKEISNRIVSIRSNLLRMKRYYDQLSMVLERLIDNENAALTPSLINRFSILNRRVEHLSDTVTHLRECVTQVREAYQAQIDIEQNQVMKIFTVITAVFLPLTLIVGWYGMNFQIPEYQWHWGYFYVIVLSIAVMGVSLWMIVRKKWF